MLNGRAVVIFDGLDELVDTSYRQEISNNVESFCNLYPSVPVLVTSREVGYEQAPLDKESFEILRLAPFNREQVLEYVRRWFATDSDLTGEQQKQKAASFMQESNVVPDLRSNPLMLALMCNIYRGENYIPKNRPRVYEKCADMLFERWDKSRGIQISLPFEEHIKPTMMYLAYWIYSDQDLRNGVTEQKLIAKATEYLSIRRFEDYDEAERAARNFIEFCRGRAWVFTDIGTTKDGESLYQFTHTTFLEYFTAAYLVRIHRTPHELGKILVPRIAYREWDVVAQLAFLIKNANQEGAGDELLTELLEQSIYIKREEEWNLLSFAARCLQFMIPSPKITRRITETCLQSCLKPAFDRSVEEETQCDEKDEDLTVDEGIETLGESDEVIVSLLTSAVENRDVIKATIEKLLLSYINGDNERGSLFALEIALELSSLPLETDDIIDNDALELWENTSRIILDNCSNRINALAQKYRDICVELFWNHRVTVSDLVKWHGIEAIFREVKLGFLPERRMVSPARRLVRATLLKSYRRTSEYNFKVLRELAPILLSSVPPWIVSPTHLLDLGNTEFLFGTPKNWKTRQVINTKFDPDELFGTLALLAVWAEAHQKSVDERRRIEYWIRSIKKSTLPFLNLTRSILVARFDVKEISNVQNELDMCGFIKDQQDFLWKWIKREIDLIDLSATNSTE